MTRRTLGATRRSTKRLYRHELKTEGEHCSLLRLLRELPARIALSGYRHPLYDEMLPPADGWRRIDFPASTRGGPAVESLWLNYSEPAALHESTYLGANFRERERIRRKQARWRRRLVAMPPLERRAMLELLQSLELASPAAPSLERAPGLDPLAIVDGEDRIACAGGAGSA